MPGDVSASAKLAKEVEAGVCQLLNDWLRPPIAFDAVPKPNELIVHLFGSAWYELVFIANSRYRVASQTVRLWQPPFLPGVAHSEDHFIEQSLPDLCA